MYSVAPPRVAAFLQYKEVSPVSSSVANERFLGLLDQLFKQNFASVFFFFFSCLMKNLYFKTLRVVIGQT